jgi:hypothetical protein
MIILKTSMIINIFMIYKILKIKVIIVIVTFLVMNIIIKMIRQYATSFKFAVSIPSEVVEVFD